MLKLLLPCVIVQISHCTLCPDGFDLGWSAHGRECRGSIATMSLTRDEAVNTAISECSKIQALPVIIHDDEQYSYWYARVDTSSKPLLLLGIICNRSSTKWEWEDGSAMDFIPSTHSKYLDQSCQTGMNFYIDHDYGFSEWNNPNGQFPVDISCTQQVHIPSFDEECSLFADDTDDGVCYQVGEVAETWQDAQMICKKLGANIASVHSLQENSFLRRLAVSKGDVTGLILGATISGKADKFGWIDGTEWDYDNFAPGFPKTGFGDCIVMDTSTSSGLWKNMDCSAKYPVACIKDKKAPSEPATCSTDTWKEGSIVTSPGFPYNASIPCDYYLMVDEGKNVEVEIILLEANPFCDNLILYDGYVGGIVLANLTGDHSNATCTTTSSHIMLASWAGNGGADTLGFALTFRGV